MIESQNRPKTTREAKRLSADMARVGQVLSERYELLELLGHGGMGAVYKARHTLMDRIVAVKMLLLDVADDPAMHDRFKREAKSSGKINHPNVVQLIDFGEGPEGAYIVIEFLDGIGLDQLIREVGPLDPKRAVHIFQQICDGVGKAHLKGIVHRDLKPSNIMLVNEDGDPDFVKIVDFGLAKIMDPSEESQRLTQTGEVFGSPVYMSPQQCLGHPADPRSDVYALGVLMYETLTGKVPILGANVAETIARQLQEIPKPFAEVRPDLDIPYSLEKVVLKALAKDPEERQASMQEMKEELYDAMLPKLQAKKKTTATVPKPQPGPAHLQVPNDDKTRPVNTGAMNLSSTQPAYSNGSINDKLPLDNNQTQKCRPRPSIEQAVPHAVPYKLIAAIATGIVFVAGAWIFTAVSLHPKDESKPQQDSQPLHPVAVTEMVHVEPVNNPVNKAHIQIQSASQDAVEKKKQEIERKEARIAAEIARLKAQAASKRKKHADNSRTAELPAQKKSNHIAESTSTSEPVARPERHRRSSDWHDFSYGFEKKEEYTHSWNVPMAGSKSQGR